MKSVQLFKATRDDWRSSYRLNNGELYVMVSFTQTGPNPPTQGEWRVCVWGDDDCGMEKDFLIENEAWLTFVTVIGWEYVNMDALKLIGFVSA